MALIDLKCKNCNGMIQMDDSREIGFCTYCGNRFIVRDEIMRVAIEHSGTVQLDRKLEAQNYYMRAQQIIDENNNDNISDHWINSSWVNRARDYIEKALDIDVKHTDALRLKKGIEDRVQQLREKEQQLREKVERGNNIGCFIFLFIFVIIFILILKSLI